MQPNQIYFRISLLIICLSLFSCGSEEAEETKTLRPVLYQKVEYAGSLNERTFTGIAQSDKVVNLSFRTSGIITQFDMYLGQRVKKGQLLAKLDNVSSRLSYEQAQTSLSSAESQMKTAKLSYDRIRSLYEKGSASLSDFENTKNAFRNAENSYKSAQRSVQIQKEQINYGFIYAPDDGVISSIGGEVGENASPGQTMAVLNAGNQITIDLGVPENIINSVQNSMQVDLVFSALPNQKFTGNVTEISPALDRNTSTYPVKVTLTSISDGVRAGMAASVTFRFSNIEKQSLLVPAKAVGEDSQGRFVFLITENSESATVNKQRIKIGQLHSNGFEVLDGLKQGQKIAVAGLQTLLDGQEVRLQN
ncbi:efflux RND transporter periplasmic adaptor subunit [Ekhidna sp.]